MGFFEVVGVLVVGAEHDAVGMGAEEGVEGFEVFGGAAFADEDLQVGGGVEFFEGFFEGVTFVIGADVMAEVFGDACAAEAGRVAIDGFARGDGVGDFGEEVGVVVDDAGVVHDFGEVADAGVLEEFADVIWGEGYAGGFEVGGGDAGGSAE